MLKNEKFEIELQSRLATEAFKSQAHRTDFDPNQMTSTVMQAAFEIMIELLKPADILEIGTMWAHSTRVFAEALLKTQGGMVTTLDPFGGHRIPGIVASWPEALQARTRFHALNSMSYFLELEIARTPIGARAPFNIAFVDGHHSFEYAYFDLMRSALYLRPGGVIVADNVEQAGPAAAVQAFLQSRKHWRIFTQDGYVAPDFRPESIYGSSGAILLAPDGIEIGTLPHKINLYGINQSALRALRFDVKNPGVAGTLTVNANLYATPDDYGTTGDGMVNMVKTVSQNFSSVPETLEMAFPGGLEVVPRRFPTDVSLEIELSFSPATQNGPTLLIASDPAVTLV